MELKSMHESSQLSSDTQKDDNMIFDDVLESLNAYGCFQRRFFVLFVFLLMFSVIISYMNLVFVLSIPDHWCHSPGREASNMSVEEWKKITIPREINFRNQEAFSKCYMYNMSNEWKQDQRFSLISSNSSYNNIQTIKCEYGWEYDQTWYISTVSSEQNWVCDNEIYVSNILAAMKIGDFFGTLIFGQMGDIFGRRPVFLITLIIMIIGRLMSSFSAHNYWLFTAAAVIGNLATPAVYVAPIIIAMEITREDKRSHVVMLQSLGLVFAMCTVPIIMWLFGDWFIFMLITTLPLALFLCFPKYLIESPRWLLSRGRVSECIKQLKIIARVNKTSIQEDMILRLRKYPNRKENVYGVMSLFSSKRLAKNTTILIICWSILYLTYFTLIFNVMKMTGNPFFNFLIQSIIEIPAYITSKNLCERFGRRVTQFGSFLLSFFMFILIIICSTDSSLEWLVIYLTVLARFGMSSVFYVINLQTLEIFPTCARQSGTAICGIIANAVSVMSPYIVYMGTTYNVQYPYLILASFVLCGCVIGTFLPETLRQKLPETLMEAHCFGDGQTYWDFLKCGHRRD